jgi:osmotically inducible protein OsmC
LAGWDEGRQRRISTESGALKRLSLRFRQPFRRQRGSNTEELIAAAHASCFTMALSLILGEAKLTAQQMNTSADSHTGTSG